jgi:hypothetical protein
MKSKKGGTMQTVTEMIQPVDLNFLSVFPKALHDFSWIDDFFRTQALTAELEEKTRERNQVATVPVPKSDRMEGLKVSFSAYLERRQAVLKEFLSLHGGSGDAFRYFDSVTQVGTRILHLPPAITLEEVRQAFESLPEAVGTMPLKEKEKTIGKLTKRIGELEKEIAAVFPERYHGRNGSDVRGDFVKHWTELQGSCNAPVTPEGWSLEKYGTEAERAAWKKLRLGDFENIKGGLNPYEG